MKIKTTRFGAALALAVYLGPAALAVSFVSTAFALCPGHTAASVSAAGMTEFFPELGGWTKEGEPEIYAPDNLFEYIDGAADLYLSYAFEELAMTSYTSGEKRSLTVEVYRHGDLRNAFGIYSQERPKDGRFVAIGTEGYYDTGVLNFFHGRYYVKVTGFYLEEEDERTLTAVATEVAERLGGEPLFPEALQCFPAEGKLAHSERFLALDVLGHSFLRSAFAADYETDGSALRVFLIEGKDEADAQKMLDGYVELAGKSGPVVDENGTFRFRDPRRSSDEPVHLRKVGRYMWGLFTTDTATADSYIEALENNLREHGLI
jgi:hypothetical protein